MRRLALLGGGFLLMLTLVIPPGQAEMSRAAWSVQTANPAATVTADELAAPGTPTAVENPDCSNIDVTWAAGDALADDYSVEAYDAVLGTWTEIAASTGGATSATDTTSYINTDVSYRVTGLLSGSSWSSPPSATSNVISCGIGPVTDLDVANTCSENVLTWSAPANANRYDIRVRINGGAWNIVINNRAQTNWTDTTSYNIGDNVEYQVRSGWGPGTDGNWGNIDGVGSWSDFRIVSVAFNDGGGTPGTLEAGDTVTVQFSSPADISGLANNDVRVANRRNLQVPRGTNATRVFLLGEGANFFSANGNFAGTNTLSGDGLTYTFTSTAAGPDMGVPSAAITPGRGARCAADTTQWPNPAATPVPVGQW